ncbi:hypothetical protein OHB26_33020 [Nocardia sp. NBC_01503]|uniref:hypothetical protein n=1 Tax=Nocardia sp. NBC_01503 TaxID=2975997 RepID=UPI002E7AFA42|nr:hypothetical protein [Nocardia sp. NBC_01503]WTL31679.1 hypothetical protein OHB26_33020 [Nocardia sp. NBC_01503]
MAASVIPLIPRRGFTVRRVGERWELVNSRCYGRTVVLASWPRDRHSEAFAHCYRLNGQSAAPVRNAKNAVTAAFT